MVNAINLFAINAYNIIIQSSDRGLSIVLILCCKISLTLPVDLCLYMGFLIAWRIVCSRASRGELKRTKRINQICYN